jgi:hypothetical protein
MKYLLLAMGYKEERRCEALSLEGISMENDTL